MKPNKDCIVKFISQRCVETRMIDHGTGGSYVRYEGVAIMGDGRTANVEGSCINPPGEMGMITNWRESDTFYSASVPRE